MSNDTSIESFTTGDYGLIRIVNPIVSLPDYFKIKIMPGTDIITDLSNDMILTNISTQSENDSI